MDKLSTIDQISRQSNKILFQFDLAQNKFSFLSSAFRDLWEPEHERLQEQPQLLLDTVPEEDRAVVVDCWHKLLRGEPVEKTIRMMRNGRLRHMRCSVYPIRDAAQEIVAVAGMAEDNSRQQEFVNYLAEFGHRKNSALEMVLHDLHGPLAIVQSVAALLRKDTQDNRLEEVAQYTSIIENACIQCTDLIRDLLSEEHLASPEISVTRTRVDLNKMIRSMAEFYQKGQIVQQALVLDLPQEPLVLDLDQIKISQVLNNLISNSIKFTPSTGNITIHAYQEGDEVVIEHSDTGIGIPENLHANIFERKAKVGRPGLNGEKSRGLGLSIVYELVRLHGGHISVHSREHEGARFVIRLPLYAD
ncbi:PAS domain-containing sensor histidine kinase [uncultured Pontibacter sp.]|uniref:sensor histidine kinase n=1 Tax=uncultured Pontibacter sp. TaxID=453356 RepID=UPI0026375B06|nr:PAS domain-containing sensor histidine kinase [uncultured Pontibacter sp.]